MNQNTSPILPKYEDMKHHATSEKLVEILNEKTGNKDKLFFRVVVAYYFAKLASMMRATIKTKDRGLIPVNVYALALATSGYGKNYSTTIIEDEVINQFRDIFYNDTFPKLAELELEKLAIKRATKSGKDLDHEMQKAEKEFNLSGPLLFSFDSGTTPALKQLRYKLQMANAGSLCVEVDEIGSNFQNLSEILNAGLELYDVGKIKQKLIKNTVENQRGSDLTGRTPTNMLLYGTPMALLDGGKTEAEFWTFQETGYARRCFFGYGSDAKKDLNRNPEDIYNELVNPQSNGFLTSLSDKLADKADLLNFNKTLLVSKDVTIALLDYKQYCERRASKMPDHEEVRKAEMSHRYYKALKLSGAYAFIDGSPDISLDQLCNAIKLAEESGDAFSKIMNRERNYVKLCNYICNSKKELTLVDLTEDLPFFKGATAQKQELLTLAIAYGYRENKILKKKYDSGIEFWQGETLEETNLDKIILSYSSKLGANYKPEYAPFNKLHKLTQQPNKHFANHHFVNGLRKQENVIFGFNLIAIDVDGEIDLDTAKLLLNKYTYHLYTTKSHRLPGKGDRYRILMPISHVLKLGLKEYTEFMKNIFEFLPFDSDTSTGQCNRKWETFNGSSFYNHGEIFDAIPFIPKTSKNEERIIANKDLTNLDNIERWFVNNTADGNRSNQYIKYALMLLDSGKQVSEIETAVKNLNNKLPSPMSETEIMSTIMRTVAQRALKNP